MKKITAFILLITLSISLFTSVFYAETNNKLDGKLVEKLSVMSNTEKKNVWIVLDSAKAGTSYTYKIRQEYTKKAYEECGFTEGEQLTQEQKILIQQTCNRLWDEHCHQAAIDVMQKMGATPEDIVGGWDVDDTSQKWKEAFYLSKEKILAAAGLEEIKSISLNEYKYYLTGSFNNWTIDESYRLKPQGEGTYYSYISAKLTASDTFKVVASADGIHYDEGEGYPQDGGMYNENSDVIDYSCNYFEFWFRPDGMGEESAGWYQGTVCVIPIDPQYPEPPTEPPTEDPEEGELYKAKLLEKGNPVDAGSLEDHLMYYKELYYHRDDNGAIDWALIDCCCDYCYPMELYTVIGNRVIHQGSWEIPFYCGFGVYDVKNDRFVDADSGAANRLDGFRKTMDEFDFTGKTTETFGLIGDVDRDDEISIIDTTIIQRCEALMRDYPEDDEFYLTSDHFRVPHYYSDFDRNGERDIIDATCIQRYLAGMNYPVE